MFGRLRGSMADEVEETGKAKEITKGNNSAKFSGILFYFTFTCECVCFDEQWNIYYHTCSIIYIKVCSYTGQTQSKMENG